MSKSDKKQTQGEHMKISRIVWKKNATIDQVREAESMALSMGVVLENNYKIIEGDTWVSWVSKN